MAAEMIRTSKCIGVITGLKVAAIWLELLNAATLSQFGHAPGRQVVLHGLLHGSLHHQGQTVQANLQKRAACENGPGAAETTFQAFWTWRHGTSFHAYAGSQDVPALCPISLIK